MEIGVLFVVLMPTGAVSLSGLGMVSVANHVSRVIGACCPAEIVKVVIGLIVVPVASLVPFGWWADE